MATVEPARRPVSRWIISPAADLALLVATPLAIVPLVALAGWHVAPEMIFLYVVAFASIGHHLPGLLRAYGERELFARFRWRFLLAPPIALAVALAFSWSGLHGLELVLLFWATWHILMQTYGFLRIYDMKGGIATATSAWLDFLLCLAIFSAGIVFSQARVLGIVETLSAAGVPLPPVQWLLVLRWIVCGGAIIIVLLSIAHAVTHGLRGRINPVKWLLVVSTAWLYWFCGALTTNLLVGVAMFEIFHALQYYAIVWSYNRRRARLSAGQLGWLKVLFGDSWASLLLYAAAIAAFGSLRLVSNAVPDATVQKLLLALLAASTMLHFYYDGFIWKVREAATQTNLGIEGGPRFAARSASGLHAARWSVLLAAAAALWMWESRHAGAKSEGSYAALARLAEWSPDVPDLQVRLSSAALARGDVAGALTAAQHAARLQPRSHAAHGAWGAALLRRGQFAGAAEHLRTAIELGSPAWENHFDLGQALLALHQPAAAEAALRRADRMHPGNGSIQLAWGRVAVQHTGAAAALEHFRQAAAINPSATTQLELGRAYFAMKQYDSALAEFASAAEKSPQWAEARYQLGATYFQRGDNDDAVAALQHAIRLQPDHGPAHFHLSNLYHQTGDLLRAAAEYRRCTELLPESPEVHNNRGAVLFELGQLEGAAAAYRSELRLEPQRGDAHYNLSLVYLEQGNLIEAREQLAHAQRLGIDPNPEVVSALASP